MRRLESLAAAAVLRGAAGSRHNRGGAAALFRASSGSSSDFRGAAVLRAATGGLRRVPVPRVLGGAGRLVASVRAGGAAPRPPRLPQSHQQRAVRGGADGRPGGSPDGMCLQHAVVSVVWLSCGLCSLLCLQRPGPSPRLLLFLQEQHLLLSLKKQNDNRSF